MGRFGRTDVKLAIGVFAVILIVGSGLAWGAMHWIYSDGQRAGYVQKFSHRGWPCKTWEGELAMTALPGMVLERFRFTVPSDAVAARVNAAVGKRVALHYQQYKWVPNSCLGDTHYFVTDVRVIE
jgi:hypothetical protein